MISLYKGISDLPQELQSNIKNNLFFSSQYFSLCKQDGYDTYILTDGIYLIPFSAKKRYCFKFGGFIFEPVKACTAGDESIQNFLDSCLDFLKKKQHIQFITVNPAYTNFLGYPHNSVRIPFGNYICDLEQSEEDLFAAVHSKHRNCIRKAIKDGVYVESGCTEDLLDKYMDMDRATWERSQCNGVPKEFYLKRMASFPDNCRIFISYFDGVPQSGAFIYYDADKAYYMFGANKDHPHNGAGNLLQWEIVLWLKKIGVKSYSFVGCRIQEDEDSKYHEIQRFKQRFGGELLEGYMFKSVLNPVMYKLYVFALSLKKVHLCDAVDEEVHKWANINTII